MYAKFLCMYVIHTKLYLPSRYEFTTAKFMGFYKCILYVLLDFYSNESFILSVCRNFSWSAAARELGRNINQCSSCYSTNAFSHR